VAKESLRTVAKTVGVSHAGLKDWLNGHAPKVEERVLAWADTALAEECGRGRRPARPQVRARAGAASAPTDLSTYPEDTPAEAIIRAYSDLAGFHADGGPVRLEDVVLLAYARALRERLGIEEMGKLDAWRNLVLAENAIEGDFKGAPRDPQAGQ
jgi:hypothetical protein